ncbi:MULTISPECIES: dihydropteroate synthase [unclassified Marinobacter]|uniref:dihydropteroate synthase n=1 Tax=unclassified Marinobacter TaxID=83889 RepID=UPI000C0010C1|nr:MULTISPECIES: dihydropteroate synthase [unclassified Marinobacter]PFG11149.1 dihydropteroate synthase [Marinobacter sp. LV10MA510-1]PFG53022.1 dihydropteroate synthase [Marinobacter sp. LV10R520-4]
MMMNFAGRTLDMTQCHVMGVLNVTPDSFSDGGRFDRPQQALAHARQMVEDGASFIDVGGESTRPGAKPVSLQQELDRVCPVVEAIAGELDVVISVDTSAPQVMTQAAALGAGLINDVRALTREGALQAAANTGLPVSLMHSQGEPDTMQNNPQYQDVCAQVSLFLAQRILAAQGVGIDSSRIMLDLGFGFGKSLEHNLQLLARAEQFTVLGYPLLLGLSRKSMLGAITGRNVEERLPASLATATICAMKGASVVRVHDVRETVDVVKIAAAIKGAM